MSRIIWVIERRTKGGKWQWDDYAVTKKCAESDARFMQRNYGDDVEYRVVKYVPEQPTNKEPKP